MFGRNYQNFNKMVFINETLTKMNWDNILSMKGNDPNISINTQIIFYMNLLHTKTSQKKNLNLNLNPG